MDAVGELLAAWYASRDSRIAAELDKTLVPSDDVPTDDRAWLAALQAADPRAVGGLLVGLENGHKTGLRRRLQALAGRAPFPRIARRLLQHLQQPRWRADGRGTRPVRRLAVETLVRHGGPVHRGELLSLLDDLTTIYTRDLAYYLRNRIEAVVDDLPSERPLATAPTVLASAPTGSDDVSALEDHCWATPEDTDARAVLADRLTEHDDPMGEFIALQLQHAVAPEAKGKRQRLSRMKAVVKAHGERLMGPLAAVCNPTRTTFERGFPVGVHVLSALPVLDAELIQTPAWGHIRHLTVSRLAKNRASAVRQILEGSPLTLDTLDQGPRDLADTVARFPSVRRLGVDVPGASLPPITAFGQLTEVAFHHDLPGALDAGYGRVPNLEVLNGQVGLLGRLPETVTTFVWRQGDVQFTARRTDEGVFRTVTVKRKGAGFGAIHRDFRGVQLVASDGILKRIAQRA